MRTLSRLLSILLLLGAGSVWANTDTATTTLTISPSATAGTTVLASDENSRNNAIVTWANAHVHTLPNTTSFGDGSAGNKSLCANAADSTDACIRWNDTANLWTVDNPTPGTFNQIATLSGTSGIASNSVVLGGGTGVLTTVSGTGTSGQVLKSNGASAPTWQADVVSGRVQYTGGDITISSATLTDVTSASITLTTAAHPVLISWQAVFASNFVNDTVAFNVTVDGALQLGTVGHECDSSVSGQNQDCSFTFLTAPLTAASHTFKIKWKNDGVHTATIQASTDILYTFSVVEVNS